MRKRRTSGATAGAISLVILLVVVLVAIRFVGEIAQEKSPESGDICARVIDGDTVELANGETVRLLFIDTPEKGERFFDSALALTERLSLGQVSTTVLGARKRDGYGRLLAVLMIDTLNLNLRLLEQGYANVYLFSDNMRDPSQQELIAQMISAQRRAITAKRGVWSIPHAAEELYVTTKNSLRFHRTTCRSVAGRNPLELRRFDSREEPLFEGLSPCRTCRP